MTRQEEVEDLVRRLEQHRTGATAHTAGKAINYLRWFLRDGKHGKLADLELCVNSALASTDWKKLTNHMDEWW